VFCFQTAVECKNFRKDGPVIVSVPVNKEKDRTSINFHGFRGDFSVSVSCLRPPLGKIGEEKGVIFRGTFKIEKTETVVRKISGDAQKFL
jgi:hypothetical protein